MVLGHLQQGGNPTPFDRVHATRLAAYCVDWLSAQISAGKSEWTFVGSDRGRPTAEPIRTMADLVDPVLARPRDQWWLALRPVMAALATEPD